MTEMDGGDGGQDREGGARDEYAPDDPEGPEPSDAPPAAAWPPLPPPPGSHEPSTWSAGPPPPSQLPGRGFGFVAIASVLVVALMAGAGAWLWWGPNGKASGHDADTARQPIRIATPAPTGDTNTGPLDQKAIAAKLTPSVVDVDTVLGGLDTSSGSQPTGEAAGTGMVVSSSGEILTNNHVVDGATSIRVTIGGGSSSYNATVLGVNPIADVALLQVQGVSGLPTVTFASSSTVQLGQRVVAIGNALGKGGAPAVTQGTVTGLDRSITASVGGGGTERLTGLIQSDAVIKPGDSGGPLVNENGQVIGMITAAATRGPGRLGSDVGFAIPIDTAVGIVNEIRAGHETGDIILGKPGYLGIQVQDLTPGAAAQLGLNVDSGVLVIGVVPGGPAAKAGIDANSVITAIDGQPVTSADTLGPQIHTHGPGEQIRVTWVDGRGTHTASVTLIAGPAV